MDCGDGEFFSVLPMKGHGGRQVDVSHAVAIGEEEFGVVANERLDLENAAGGHGILARVGQGDRPIFFAVVIVEAGIGLLTQAQRDVAGHPEVIAEVILDHVPLVTEAKNEFLESEGGIKLHDMPQNGAVADMDHRFGTILGFLPQPGSLAAA